MNADGTAGTIQLRSERSGTGTGRTYTITATAGDLSSNSTMATFSCVVPHDQGNGNRGRGGGRP